MAAGGGEQEKGREVGDTGGAGTSRGNVIMFIWGIEDSRRWTRKGRAEDMRKFEEEEEREETSGWGRNGMLAQISFKTLSILVYLYTCIFLYLFTCIHAYALSRTTLLNQDISCCR